jgi:hypothetical protein
VEIVYGTLSVLTGILVGGLYFFLLFSAVRQQVAQAARIWIVPLHFGRFGLALIIFWAVAQQGAIPLLLCLVGFLAARFWALRRLGVG